MTNHPLRLPGYRITGNTTPVPGGLGVTGEQEAFSWTGRVVGLSEDRVRLPIMWTLGSLAGMRGVAEDAYAATHPYALTVNPSNFQKPITVPKAVIHYGNPDISDGAVDIQDSLLANNILVAKIAHSMATGETSTHPFNIITPATGYDDTLTEDLSSLGFGTVTYTIPTGDLTRWIGGEVLAISIFQIDDAFDIYSAANIAFPGTFLTFPDIIARARADYEAWRARYDRVKLLIIAHTPTPDAYPAGTAHNRGVFQTAVSGLPDVEFLDLGIVDDPTRINQTKAAATQAMQQFFSLL